MLRREQREKWKECEEAGAGLEQQLHQMTEERDAAQKDEGTQIATLRAQLVEKTQALAAAEASRVAEDDAAEEAVQAGQAAFLFANETVARLELELAASRAENAKLSEAAQAAQAAATAAEGRARNATAGLAVAKETATTEERVVAALEKQLASEAAEVAAKDAEIAELQHAGEEPDPPHAVAPDPAEGGKGGDDIEGLRKQMAEKLHEVAEHNDDGAGAEDGDGEGEDEGAVDEFVVRNVDEFADNAGEGEGEAGGDDGGEGR